MRAQGLWNSREEGKWVSMEACKINREQGVRCGSHLCVDLKTVVAVPCSMLVSRGHRTLGWIRTSCWSPLLCANENAFWLTACR